MEKKTDKYLMGKKIGRSVINNEGLENLMFNSR